MNSAICLLERAAARFPARTAVEDVGGALTYAELREKSRSAAEGLLAIVRSDRPVMLFLPKSAEMVAGMLAVLYAGRAYVPMDAAAPMERVKKIAANLAPSAIITTAALRKRLEALALSDTPVCTLDELTGAGQGGLVDAAVRAVTDADPIYIMYTSGSTGEPKGVVIPHRSVLNFARWAAETFRWDEHTVIANQAALCFDVSVMDVYGALCSGGKLILTPEALFRYPSKLPEFLAENAVTSIYWVPTVMIHVANSGALSKVSLPLLKAVCFAGEVMPNLQLNAWRRALPNAVFANLYGPTETDVCTAYIVDRPFSDEEPLPIGTALPNLRVLLLDAAGRPADEGEICVSGAGVTSGYFGRPDLTERAFLSLERGGVAEQFYRTGDLGRYNERGEILFLGRMDGLIKLRGNRIELGEVESAGRAVEGISNCCVLFDSKKEQIVLFAETRAALGPGDVIRAMRRYIPAYMLPERVELMEALPCNQNRKIDRAALKRRMEEA